jgi:hypothetical protein
MTIVGYGFDAAANKPFYLVKNSWGIIDPWTGGPGWGEMVSSRAAAKINTMLLHSTLVCQ